MKNFRILLLILWAIGFPMTSNMSVVKAADIGFEKFGHAYILNIDGKIEKGDFDKFMETLSEIFVLSTAEFQAETREAQKQNPDAYTSWVNKYGEPKGAARITVSLNSTGGDVEEALKIGKSMRDMLLSTETGFRTRNNEFQNTKCMSACFFIWVSGADRNAYMNVNYKTIESPLGIHRLYFDPDYYKGLTSEQAEIEYKKLKNEAKDFLQEMGVSGVYFERMFSVPSNDVYILSEKEVDSLDGKVPYYEELLFSKCGTYTKQERQDYDDCLITMIGIKNGTFPDALITMKKEITNKCTSVSSAYLAYIESKVEETEDCWSVHDGIERWQRMNKYFGSKLRVHK